MIEKTLNYDAAERLFKENAIFISGAEYVPDYRAYDLFGKRAARLFANKRLQCFHTRIESGGYYRIYEIINEPDGTQITLFPFSAFLEFVKFNNFSIMRDERSKSQGAASWDQVLSEKRAEIARADAEITAEELAKDLAEKESGEGEP